MVILRSAFTVKVGGVEVKQYVNDYKLTQGRGQPFPVIHMVLSPANKVDGIATVVEGASLTVSACGEGVFIITDVEKEDNEYRIVGLHKSVRLKEQVISSYSDISPEGVFSDLATSLGYAPGDITAPATSYGDIAIPGGENAWEVIRYLADLTGRRPFFTSARAYFISDPSATTITIGGATPTVTPLTRPAVIRGSDDVINSVRVLYEMGEVTDSDAASISAHGERRVERRSFTTEDPDSHALPRVDAVNLASQLIADNKDPMTGLRYQVRERARDGGDNQVWEQSHPIDSVGNITDNYSSTTLTAVALERITHHYPMIATTYEWGQVGDELGHELSRLSSEVADRAHNGTLGNDLSSRPVAIQVYGDQNLEGFDPDTLTGFYLGKKKDSVGNDVYIWAGVNAGTEQVRMDTDGILKAGQGAVRLNREGMFTYNTSDVQQIKIGVDGVLKAGQGKISLESNGLSFDVTGMPSFDGRTALRYVDDTSGRADKVRGHISYWGGDYGSLYVTSYTNAEVVAPQVIISGSSTTAPTTIRNTNGDVLIHSSRGRSIINRIEFKGAGPQNSSWRINDVAMFEGWEDIADYIEYKAGEFRGPSKRIDMGHSSNGVCIPSKSIFPTGCKLGDLVIRDRGSGFSGRDRYGLCFAISSTTFVRIDNAVTATITSSGW